MTKDLRSRNKAAVLIIEDEDDIVRVLRFSLERAGYLVLQAGSAEAGLAAARRSKPDLVLLDIKLPGMDGLECFRLLRQSCPMPVIFLTARRSETDRVLGLKLGAEDYVVKPFFPAEVVARVGNLLRRARSAPSGNGSHFVHLGSVEVDVARHEVRLAGRPLTLTPKEFELLKSLLAARGKVLSREELLERVWGHDRSVEIDTRTVDQHVSRLRGKLGPERRRIATVPHYGYRLSSRDGSSS